MRPRLLLLAAMLLTIATLTTRADAGGPGGICCVCDCGVAGTACTTSLGPNFCDEYFASGCGFLNASCATDVVGSPCAEIPACATAAPEPAPAAGAGALTAIALLLAAIGAWRLHAAALRR